MKKIILALSLVVLCSCGSKTGGTENIETNTFQIEGNQITLSENSPILNKISIEAVNSSDYQATFTTSGIVRAIPTNYAEIASPFAGRIVKSFVRLGQKVTLGSPIFEISSPSFFETGKVYCQAKQEMELALKSLNREKDLLANNVGVAKEVEEAEVNYELKMKDYENAFAAIKVFQIDPDKMTLGQPLIVRSPIAGEVVKNNIIIGQYIKEDAEPLALVADLSKVWVVAHVKEKDICLIQHLSNVQIHLTSMPNETIEGKIYHISELLEEDTRAVEVIIECNNPERKLKPFMYGTVKLTDVPTKAFVIPNSAVLQSEESTYVLVSEGANKFRKSDILIASANEKETVIISGLNDGDKIVTEGAYYFIEAR